MRKLRFEKSTAFIFISAIFVYFIYSLFTNVNERNYDTGAQIFYIDFIANNYKLPVSNACWVCHHPPLFYISGAIVKKLSVFLDFLPETALQIHSLILFLVFLVFSLLTIRLFFRKAWKLNFAFSIVAFWPYSIVNSVRIHNDVLFYTFSSAFLYYLLLWHQKKTKSGLFYSCIFAGLGILTKTNGAIALAVILTIFSIRTFRASEKFSYLKKNLIFLSVPFLTFIFLVLILNPLRTPEKKIPSIFGTAATVDKSFYVENKPLNFFAIDIKSYWKEPYVLAEKDGYGREYFWQHLIKSSLFGTHNSIPDPATSYGLNQILAQIMNWILNVFILVLFLNIFWQNRFGLFRYLPFYIFIVCSIGSLGVFKFLAPIPHHNDFRLIYPVIIPMSIFFFQDSIFIRKVRYANPLVLVFSSFFILLSVVYYIPYKYLVVTLGSGEIQKPIESLSNPVLNGSVWNAPSNILMKMDDRVSIHLKSPRDISEVEISLDNNDSYIVYFESETNRITRLVGPDASSKVGMSVYRFPISPVFKNLKKIEIRPFRGDGMYSLGHILLF